MTGTGVNECWKRTGVQGDRSCPELARAVHCRNCPVFERGARTLLDREPPPGYLDEWTRLLAQAKPAEEPHTDTAITFRVGAEWLGLPARTCAEIVEPRPIRPVPHRTGPILLGVASVRGELLLCVSLAAVLEIQAAAPVPAARPRLVVVRKDRSAWLFPVEDVGGLLRYHADRVRPVPATVAHAVPRFSRGLLMQGDRVIGLLDEDRVFKAWADALTG